MKNDQSNCINYFSARQHPPLQKMGRILKSGLITFIQKKKQNSSNHQNLNSSLQNSSRVLCYQMQSKSFLTDTICDFVFGCSITSTVPRSLHVYSDQHFSYQVSGLEVEPCLCNRLTIYLTSYLLLPVTPAM